ncbi:hypothetical protein CSOJ01_08106 [Colletotrichum sojae]|uniref:Uncharacterized protein n=1 Tax=Colletotrichum sojae TaxID=2175907 RepID=A0A8H6J7T5_9PEZI|nr:hypothetical protein CSOJ01_08106 [Colletotrichum sojae]
MCVRGLNRSRAGCSDALEGSHLVTKTKLCLCGGQEEGDLTVDYCSPRLISTRGPLPSASRWTAAITKVDLPPIPQANRHKIAREERGRYSKDTFWFVAFRRALLTCHRFIHPPWGCSRSSGRRGPIRRLSLSIIFGAVMVRGGRLADESRWIADGSADNLARTLLNFLPKIVPMCFVSPLHLLNVTGGYFVFQPSASSDLAGRANVAAQRAGPTGEIPHYEVWYTRFHGDASWLESIQMAFKFEGLQACRTPIGESSQ